MRKYIIAVLVAGLCTVTQAGVITKTVKRHPVLLAGAGIYLLSSIPHVVSRLAEDPEESAGYFNRYPQNVQAVLNEIANRLRTAKNLKDYQTYKSLADYIGIKDVPAYTPDLPQLPGIEYPNIDIANNIHTPISPNLPNIIYTPEGVRIDTKTEFPNEEITHIRDYLNLQQASVELANNMERDTGVKKPANHAAHHIVPHSSKLAQQARDI